jgi:hypothetical protein
MLYSNMMVNFTINEDMVFILYATTIIYNANHIFFSIYFHIPFSTVK